MGIQAVIFGCITQSDFKQSQIKGAETQKVGNRRGGKCLGTKFSVVVTEGVTKAKMKRVEREFTVLIQRGRLSVSGGGRLRAPLPWEQLSSLSPLLGLHDF